MEFQKRARNPYSWMEWTILPLSSLSWWSLLSLHSPSISEHCFSPFPLSGDHFIQSIRVPVSSSHPLVHYLYGFLDKSSCRYQTTKCTTHTHHCIHLKDKWWYSTNTLACVCWKIPWFNTSRLCEINSNSNASSGISTTSEVLRWRDDTCNQIYLRYLNLTPLLDWVQHIYRFVIHYSFITRGSSIVPIHLPLHHHLSLECLSIFFSFSSLSRTHPSSPPPSCTFPLYWLQDGRQIGTRLPLPFIFIRRMPTYEHPFLSLSTRLNNCQRSSRTGFKFDSL